MPFADKNVATDQHSAFVQALIGKTGFPKYRWGCGSSTSKEGKENTGALVDRPSPRRRFREEPTPIHTLSPKKKRFLQRAAGAFR